MAALILLPALLLAVGLVLRAEAKRERERKQHGRRPDSDSGMFI